jgi:Tol biopolymer transport system component
VFIPMPLTPGTRLGSYEVTGSLGAGGMGEVYRARDHRLGRDVALKILPQAFAQDPDRIARFEREARTLAALNHPNIAAIYGIEESGGLRALVMELVPGRTLDQVAASTSRPSVGESIAIARAIAEGLEAAHDAGIIHRDLKPANVKVRDDGLVKVLDFGLAKTVDESAFGSSQAEAATLTSTAVTQAGLILGTAAYMAPEQARGKPVDKRADVWAFGVVLYELLTGSRLFSGETVSDVVAAVLTKPIDLVALPAEVPPRVRELAARCLERDPKKRLRDIGEARIVLEAPEGTPSLMSRPLDLSVAAGSRAPAVVPAEESSSRGRSLPVWAWVTLAAILVGGYLGVKQLNRVTALTATAAQTFRLEIGAPPDGELSIVANVGSVIVSPDGTMVAFAVQASDGSKLFIRNLLTGETRPLPGVTSPQYPFWSPDSRKIGVFLGNQLATVAIAGGLPEMIATATNGRGGAWTEDGTILYAPIGGGTIFRVPARGGEAKQITTLDLARGENAHYWPVALPGGKKFLFFVRSVVPENNGIYLGSVDGASKPVRVMASLSSPLYAPPRDGQPGKLLWVRDAELLAQPFDPETAALIGEVSSVATDVRVEESQRGTFASVSKNGTIVWASARAADFQFVWYDRSGKRLGVVPVPAGKIILPNWAPDGHAIAYTRAFGGSADIMQYDVASGIIRALTTDSDYDEFSRWSPDSRKIAYQGRIAGKVTLLVAPVDGSAPPVALANPAGLGIGGFTADGKSLVLTHGDKQTLIGLVRLSRPGTIEPLLNEPGLTDGAAVSPDGRWLAFTTTSRGKPEIVVAPFSDDGTTARLGDRRMQISSGGAYAPIWRKDSREIVYSTLDNRVMSVTFSGTGIAFVPSTPATLFKAASPTNQTIAFTANAELAKFVVVEAPFANGERLQVLTGWK